MLDLGAIERCAELTTAHATQAAGSSTEMKKLLARVAAIAEPETGCPKILTAIAQLTTADWVEGDLRVELSGDDKGTTLVVYCEHGVGIRERLLPPTYFRVPVDEFQRAVLLAPRLVAPLRATQGLNRLTLAPESGEAAAPLFDFELDEQSLGDGERTTSPPPSIEPFEPRSSLPPPLDAFAVHEAPTAKGTSGLAPAFGARSAAPPAVNASTAPPPTPRVKDHSDVHSRPTVRGLSAVPPEMIEAALKKSKSKNG